MENSLNKVNEENLAQIYEKKIKNDKAIPKFLTDKVNKKIFINLLLAVSIIAFFIFINLGYQYVEKTKFILNLKVYSFILLAISLTIFEISYKKDNEKLALYGIETLVLAIITLYSTALSITNEKFKLIINLILIVFAVYYILKCIIIERVNIIKYKKGQNDIKTIIKNN